MSAFGPPKNRSSTAASDEPPNTSLRKASARFFQNRSPHRRVSVRRRTSGMHPGKLRRSPNSGKTGLKRPLLVRTADRNTRPLSGSEAGIRAQNAGIRPLFTRVPVPVLSRAVRAQFPTKRRMQAYSAAERQIRTRHPAPGRSTAFQAAARLLGKHFRSALNASPCDFSRQFRRQPLPKTKNSGRMRIRSRIVV